MSYYTSRHPGLYAYLILLCLTATNFAVLPHSTVLIGALSVLWGIICTMRALSLYEIAEYYEDYATAHHRPSKMTNTQTTGLAYDLTRNMRTGDHFKRGLAALECIEPRTLLWFGLAALYAVSSYYLNETGNITAGLNLEKLSLLFMIGATFWIGQSYAHSLFAARIIGALCLILLTGAAWIIRPEITPNILHTALTDIISNPSLIMLIALIAYSAGALFHAAIENPKQFPLVFTGLILLSALCLSFFALEPSKENIAFWLPGWTAFSLLWIRSAKAPQKRYTLFPC